MDLREETRSLEQVRESLETVAYTDKAELQTETQRKLYNRTVNVVMDISALPLGEQKFGKEIQMITAAAGAMNDATEILGRPDTGREAIAAETEAIELLLQAKRANPKSGGGGGGSNPGGGGTGDTDRVALELYGPGLTRWLRLKHAVCNNRPVRRMIRFLRSSGTESMRSSMHWRTENSLHLCVESLVRLCEIEN